jgi:hypothetical protein
MLEFRLPTKSLNFIVVAPVFLNFLTLFSASLINSYPLDYISVGSAKYLAFPVLTALGITFPTASSVTSGYKDLLYFTALAINGYCSIRPAVSVPFNP